MGLSRSFFTSHDGLEGHGRTRADQGLPRSSKLFQGVGQTWEYRNLFQSQIARPNKKTNQWLVGFKILGRPEDQHVQPVLGTQRNLSQDISICFYSTIFHIISLFHSCSAEESSAKALKMMLQHSADPVDPTSTRKPQRISVSFPGKSWQVSSGQMLEDASGI